MAEIVVFSSIFCLLSQDPHRSHHSQNPNYHWPLPKLLRSNVFDEQMKCIKSHSGDGNAGLGFVKCTHSEFWIAEYNL